MAAVAQYYSDNLQAEVIKGLDEKVRQDWPNGLAPYGYINVDDRDEPVKPHPEKSQSLVRIFELYSGGNQTFKSLADQLEREGHVFRSSCPRFNRTALSWILSNRFYVGELHRHGHVYEGKYRRLIDTATFNACQDILHGRNRRTGTPEHPFAGGLFRCQYCGQSITGERIRRKLKGGGVREHLYYRCANNNPGCDHPTVRWKSEDLEQAIVEDLSRMQMPSPEIAEWFRNELRSAVADLTSYRRQQATSLTKRKSELRTMQDRLLNAYLAGTVDEDVYKSKTNELKAQSASVDESLAELGVVDPTRGQLAVTLFDWTQKVAEIWRASNTSVRRQILDSVCLNRTLSDVTLDAKKRKPFDIFAERPVLGNSRDDRI